MAVKRPRKGKGKARKSGAQTPALRLFYGVFALVAVVGLGGIGYAVAHRNSAMVVDPIELTGVDSVAALVRQAQGVMRGRADAPVQVLVFSDFTCPGCRMFAQQIEPRLRSAFIDSGMVRLVFHDLPLGGMGQHRWGFVAARAARCANEQHRFWELHDMLFARQNEWSYTPDAPVDAFVGYARQLGIDPSAFTSCLTGDRYADVVTANGRLGNELGVHSTPTVFIGSRSIAAWNDWSQVRQAVERQLGRPAS